MKQKITKDFLRNHFTYQLWIYISLALFSVIGLGLIFTVTTPKIPEEKQIVTIFMDDFFGIEDYDGFVAQAAEVFPDMEHISFEYTPMSSSEGQQKFQVILAANEGDVYVIDKVYLSYFATEGIICPLDEYIEAGWIDTSGIDLSSTSFVRTADPDMPGDVSDGVEHVWAIPADHLYGMMSELMVDNRNKVMMITSYSGNEENAAKMMQWLYDRFYYEEEPDFVDNFDMLIESLREGGYGF